MTSKVKKERRNTRREEAAYLNGARMASVRIIGECLRDLGYNGSERSRSAALVMEIESAKHRLVGLILHLGVEAPDNNTHLADWIGALEKELCR